MQKNHKDLCIKRLCIEVPTKEKNKASLQKEREKDAMEWRSAWIHDAMDSGDGREDDQRWSINGWEKKRAY